MSIEVATDDGVEEAAIAALRGLYGNPQAALDVLLGKDKRLRERVLEMAGGRDGLAALAMDELLSNLMRIQCVEQSSGDSPV